ncbi:MAG: transposase family protein, partial [Chloroflexi bacterium]|nr:transposase family protein [Chloroflexota bacterium]
MTVSTVTTINPLAKLQDVLDARRRQGRLYPLASVLGMLILAALNGEGNLRGMLGWGEHHWQQFFRPLGFKVGTPVPVYGTVWRVLHLLRWPRSKACWGVVGDGHGGGRGYGGAG